MSEKQIPTTKNVSEEALNEIRQEIIDNAKEKLKDKYRHLSRAKKVVKNLEREIEDLEEKIDQDLKDAE
jgi:ABC-type Fe3+-hydroxamate transport system substrate-binding protein